MKLETTKLPYLPNSESLLFNLSPKGGLVALESSLPNHENGRWSIISAEPCETLNLIDYQNNQELMTRLTDMHSKLPPNNLDLPFTGGVIGHVSYDLGLPNIEKRPDSTTPAIIAGLYTWAFLLDHKSKCTTLVYISGPSKTSKKELINIFTRSIDKTQELLPLKVTSTFKAAWSKIQYQNSIKAIHKYINAGDAYQVNLAQTFSSTYSGNPISGYEKLKKFAGVPFSSYFEHGDFAFASASPELFISVNQSEIITKPIKGTLPRSSQEKEDKKQIARLKSSKKDQAENLMIVDLLRNDISKNAVDVKVPALFEVESFETVHHLVSTITAKLSPKSTPLKLFFEAFPGGSITGAPKKRAMEIIQELEPQPRGFYCGSSFYYSANENFNSNILIRSFMFEKGNITCWAGGGIISDSKWELELQESLDKISKLMDCLND
jgi:para-aminobenzoate synthetase component 1